MRKSIKFEYGGKLWQAIEAKVGASIISLEPNAKITPVVVDTVAPQEDGTYQINFWPNDHELFSRPITVQALEAFGLTEQ